MHPAWSMILFTTLAGIAQGLMLALVGVDLAVWLGLMAAPDDSLWIAGGAIVLVLGTIGLAASTFHLGHPMRAWRAMSQWRTSWLSREVIVLPAFMGVVFLWLLAHGGAASATTTIVLGALAALLSLALFLCTGMIYAAVSVIREWATPLTPLNFMLLGLASGGVMATVLVAFTAPALVGPMAFAALLATVLGAVTRAASFWRNSTLVPKTTMQTAIGVRHPRIVQTSQGAMGGSFNTREFFHGAAASLLPKLRWVVALLVFVVPAALLALGGATLSAMGLVAIMALQYLGLLAERWLFFAEGRHPQNLYYQRVG